MGAAAERVACRATCTRAWRRSADNPGGEAAFWAEIARDRAPLLEPDRTSGYSIVTYVFAMPEGASHVVVNPGFGDVRDNPDGPHRRARPSAPMLPTACRNDLRTNYSFAPDAPLIPFDEASEADIAAMMAFMREHPPTPDPHRRHHFLIRYSGYAPDQDTSVLALPDAPDQAPVSFRKDVARGAIDLHTFHSEILRNDRRIWIYMPPAYSATTDAPYPVLGGLRRRFRAEHDADAAHSGRPDRRRAHPAPCGRLHRQRHGNLPQRRASVQRVLCSVRRGGVAALGA